MQQWKDKVALVTGASSGIGAAVAERLAAEGMKVVVTARRAERLDALDGVAMRLPADLRDVEQIAEVFARTREAFGGVDVMINNAGLARPAPLRTGSTEHFREVLEVHVLALAICTREAIADMERQGVAGHVIHISSMASHRVPPGKGGFYAATKHAVRALTEGLRKELRAEGSDIRVSAISPGFVETEFSFVENGPEKARENYSRFPCLQSEDIAEAVVYTLGQPPHVQVHDLLMRPTRQPN